MPRTLFTAGHFAKKEKERNGHDESEGKLELLGGARRFERGSLTMTAAIRGRYKLQPCVENHGTNEICKPR